MEAITVEKAVIPAMTPAAKQANMLPAGDAGETEIDSGGNKQSNELIIEEEDKA